MVQPTSPPLQTAPWIFWGNVGVGIGTTVALRRLEVPEKYYLPINMGVSIGAMSVLQWSRLVQGYSVLEVGKRFPLFYGINTAIPFAMDATLGNIPHLETFRVGGLGNQWGSLITSLWTFYRIQTRTGFVARLATWSEASSAASRAGWVGIAFLMGAGLAAAVNQISDITESTVAHFQNRNLDPTIQIKQEAKSEMEDLIWKRWYQETTGEVFERSFGGFLNSITSSVVKQNMKIYQSWIASEESKRNFVAQKEKVRIKLATDFNQWARSNLSQIIAKAIRMNPENEPYIDWSYVQTKTRELYKNSPENPNYYPNLKTFYRYDYPQNPLPPGGGGLGRGGNLSIQIEQLRSLIDEDGNLDLRHNKTSQEEVKRKQLQLVEITLEELNHRYEQLKMKYPPKKLATFSEEYRNNNKEICELSLLLNEWLPRLERMREQ